MRKREMNTEEQWAVCSYSSFCLEVGQEWAGECSGSCSCRRESD